MIEFENTLAYAKKLDKNDSLSSYRNLFSFPKHQGKSVLYFTGNSLGLQPKGVKDAILTELNDWAELGVQGHFNATNPWYFYHTFLKPQTASLLGALSEEVVNMNGLTVNLHLLFMSFYKPTKKRYKIICESKMFPSDKYMLESQIRLHGLDPHDVIVEVCPRQGKYLIEEEDILTAIEKNGDELALVFFGAVNYYTGQFFNIKEITKKAHSVGAILGLDLAHAAGNVKLLLNDWKVDFAVWCSYKYLNSGPGSIAGAFIHENHHDNEQIFKLQGWWGSSEKTRFNMENEFKAAKGADVWQLSNPPIFAMVAHKVSLDIFNEAGIDNLCEKSKKLTSYLSFIIDFESNNREVLDLKIITPKEQNRRGCQLSVLTKGKELYDFLTANGVVVDWRKPNVIRIAPVPLYNSFEDVYHFGQILNKAISSR